MSHRWKSYWVGVSSKKKLGLRGGGGAGKNIRLRGGHQRLSTESHQPPPPYPIKYEWSLIPRKSFDGQSHNLRWQVNQKEKQWTAACIINVAVSSSIRNIIDTRFEAVLPISISKKKTYWSGVTFFRSIFLSAEIYIFQRRAAGAIFAINITAAKNPCKIACYTCSNM